MVATFFLPLFAADFAHSTQVLIAFVTFGFAIAVLPDASAFARWNRRFRLVLVQFVVAGVIKSEFSIDSSFANMIAIPYLPAVCVRQSSFRRSLFSTKPRQFSAVPEPRSGGRFRSLQSRLASLISKPAGSPGAGHDCSSNDNRREPELLLPLFGQAPERTHLLPATAPTIGLRSITEISP